MVHTVREWKMLVRFPLDFWLLGIWPSCGLEWFSSNLTHLSFAEIREFINLYPPVFEGNFKLLTFQIFFCLTFSHFSFWDLSYPHMRPSALPSRSMEFCSLFVYFFSYWIIFIDLFSSPLALFSFNSFQPLNLLRDFFIIII